MKEIKKALLAAAAVTAVLALTACSGCGGDAETSQTTTTAAKTTQETSQAAKETKKITETTTKSPKTTETATTKAGGNTEETTQAQAWEPVTEEQGGGYEPITTVHQHSWVWVEPVTHVETVYESVYHPPVTHEWTHKIQQGYKWICLRCNAEFLDDRECVEHCIECGGSMTSRPNWVDITETVVDQEEYWSEEAVGTKVVTDSEGYWRCSGCGSVK